MNQANLFRLGMDLGAGTTHEEDKVDGRGHLTVITNPSDADGHLHPVESPDRDDHFIRRHGKIFAGTHLIIEVVDGHGLDDQARIEQAFRDCVEQCGATLLHLHTHKFSPQGVSGVAVLAESHISVHTWPEIGYGAFDVFMCGDADPHRAVGVLREAFSAAEVRVTELLRGEDVVESRL